MDFNEDSIGSGEKEYDTRNEEDGYLKGSRDSSGSIVLKVSSDFATMTWVMEVRSSEPKLY